MLLAGSYGTHLALAVARRHPGAVARMVLLGVEGPDDTVKLPIRVDDTLNRIDAAHPGLVASIRTLLERLRREPWTKTLPNGQAVTVGPWDLQRRVAESLDTLPKIEALGPALAGMQQGDYSDLIRWTIPFRMPRPLNVMNLAMDCASFASAERLARVREQAPAALLGDAMNFPLPGVCDVPGLPRLPDTFRAPVVSAVPALLVAGTFDGRTPPPNAEGVAKGLSRATVLIIPGASHSLFRDAGAMGRGRFLGQSIRRASAGQALAHVILRDVIRDAQRLGRDRQPRVDRRGRGKERRVDDEEILDVVGAAERIEHRTRADRCRNTSVPHWCVVFLLPCECVITFQKPEAPQDPLRSP